MSEKLIQVEELTKVYGILLWRSHGDHMGISLMTPSQQECARRGVDLL